MVAQYFKGIECMFKAIMASLSSDVIIGYVRCYVVFLYLVHFLPMDNLFFNVVIRLLVCQDVKFGLHMLPPYVCYLYYS